MAELSYVEAGGTRHINSIQEWEVKDANNIKVFLQLGGFRRNGQRNTFAMKHLMAKPKVIG